MNQFRRVRSIPMLRSYAFALLSGVLVTAKLRFGLHTTGAAEFLALVAIITAIEEASDRRVRK